MKYRLIVFAIIIILIELASFGWAQDKSLPANDRGSAIIIGSIPRANEIVIGDVTFRVASNAVFYARDKRTRVSFSKFKEGDSIGMSVSPNGEIEQMWFSAED
jgi:hypothetical protein